VVLAFLKIEIKLAIYLKVYFSAPLYVAYVTYACNQLLICNTLFIDRLRLNAINVLNRVLITEKLYDIPL